MELVGIYGMDISKKHVVSPRNMILLYYWFNDETPTRLELIGVLMVLVILLTTF